MNLPSRWASNKSLLLLAFDTNGTIIPTSQVEKPEVENARVPFLYLQLRNPKFGYAQLRFPLCQVWQCGCSLLKLRLAGLEAVIIAPNTLEESEPNPQRRFRDQQTSQPFLTPPRIKVAGNPWLQLPTPSWPLRVTPHVAKHAAESQPIG